MNGILGNIAGGLKNVGNKVAASALNVANSAERSLGKVHAALTGRPGWQGQHTFNAAARIGAVKDSPVTTDPHITSSEGLLKSMFAPTAYSDRLVPTMQLATPATQPSASSTTVPASVLTNPLAAPASNVERTGRAFVPTSPMQSAAPQPPAPAAAGVGTATAIPPAALAAPSPIAPNSPSSFGAAVPQEAIIRALASISGRPDPSGYVEAPESLAFGARPRRKLPNANL